MTATRWESREAFVALVQARREFETTKQGERFHAHRRGNDIVVTPNSSGKERPIPLSDLVDALESLRKNPTLNTSDIGGMNASYVLALCRAVRELEDRGAAP